MQAKWNLSLGPAGPEAALLACPLCCTWCSTSSRSQFIFCHMLHMDKPSPALCSPALCSLGSKAHLGLTPGSASYQSGDVGHFIDRSGTISFVTVSVSCLKVSGGTGPKGLSVGALDPLAWIWHLLLIRIWPVWFPTWAPPLAVWTGYRHADLTWCFRMTNSVNLNERRMEKSPRYPEGRCSGGHAPHTERKRTEDVVAK